MSCSKKVGDAIIDSDRDYLETLQEEFQKIVDANPNLSKAEYDKLARQKIKEIAPIFERESVSSINTLMKINQTVEKLQANKNYKDFLQSSIDLFEGTDFSIAKKADGITNILQNTHHTKLQEKGLLKHAGSGEYDVEIVAYGRAIQDGAELPKISKEAKELYDIYDEVRKLEREILNQSDINVAHRYDYFGTRNYSNDKFTQSIRKAFDNNTDDTITNMYSKKNIMQSDVFNKMRSSIKVEQGADADNIVVDAIRSILGVTNDVKGSLDPELNKLTKNAAANLLNNRKIKFVNAQAEIDFLREFGRSGTLLDQMDNSFVVTGKKSALASEVGKDMDSLKKKLRTELKASGLNEGKTLQEIEIDLAKVDQVIFNASDNSYLPSSKLNNVVKGVKAVTMLSKLGSSVFTGVYDTLSNSMQLVVNENISMGKALGRSISTFFDVAKMSKAERQKLANMLTTLSEYTDLTGAATGQGLSKFKTNKGIFDKFIEKGMAATLLPLQTAVSNLTSGTTQAVALRNIAKDFNPDNLAHTSFISRFGFTPEDMKQFAKLDTEKNFKGALAPDSVFDIDPSYFGKTSDEISKNRAELRYRISAFINSQANKGTPIPDQKTLRLMSKDKYSKKSRVSNPYQDAAIEIALQFKETAAKVLLTQFENYKILKKQGRAVSAYSQYTMASMGLYMAIEEAKSTILNKKSKYQLWQESGFDFNREGADFLSDFVNRASFAPIATEFVTSLTAPSHYNQMSSFFVGPAISGIVKDVNSLLDGTGNFKEDVLRTIDRNSGLGSNFLIRAGRRWSNDYEFFGLSDKQIKNKRFE